MQLLNVPAHRVLQRRQYLSSFLLSSTMRKCDLVALQQLKAHMAYTVHGSINVQLHCQLVDELDGLQDKVTLLSTMHLHLLLPRVMFLLRRCSHKQ